MKREKKQRKRIEEMSHLELDSAIDGLEREIPTIERKLESGRISLPTKVRLLRDLDSKDLKVKRMRAELHRRHNERAKALLGGNFAKAEA